MIAFGVLVLLLELVAVHLEVLVVQKIFHQRIENHDRHRTGKEQPDQVGRQSHPETPDRYDRQIECMKQLMQLLGDKELDGDRADQQVQQRLDYLLERLHVENLLEAVDRIDRIQVELDRLGRQSEPAENQVRQHTCHHADGGERQNDVQEFVHDGNHISLRGWQLSIGRKGDEYGHDLSEIKQCGHHQRAHREFHDVRHVLRFEGLPFLGSVADSFGRWFFGLLCHGSRNKVYKRMKIERTCNGRRHGLHEIQVQHHEGQHALDAQREGKGIDLRTEPRKES
ncbi:200 kDa antigen p200, putative [Burkholderia ambifaria IOP40-10]|uniref:200 kDa antigen p200, putative n=1 Tax=Burkholderia ambifaria IOP40-10 TaxID=396596 RepID=B1FB74_9BURK|nr:200 kDa antigen p200, putative [Burkholderia ambifaria IOP40-10]